MTSENCFKSSRPKLRELTPHSLFASSFSVCFILASLIPLSSSSSDPPSLCAGVRVAYGALGYDSKDVPAYHIPGDELRVCASSHTCCTKDVETRLSRRSREDLSEAISGASSHLRQTYAYTSQFDSFFNQLLDAAEYDLNKMFVTTYGLLYQQNSHVFTDLFADLRSYYRGGGIDLTDALDNFFATLLQKMFQLLNAQYYLDRSYLACVSNTMDELQPFGDVPDRLTLQLRRSFVAARAFVQGLTVGRDVVHKMSQLTPTAECEDAIMRSKYCAYCQGLPFLKPCNRLCLDVMKLCLRRHMEIDDAWDRYIDHILLLGDRLEGPFNIERVVDPIDVKISDAIMNFQENSAAVSKRVFKVCGTPRHHRKRKRRSAEGVGEGMQEEEEEEEKRNHTEATNKKQSSDGDYVHDDRASDSTTKEATERNDDDDNDDKLVVMEEGDAKDSIVFIDDDAANRDGTEQLVEGEVEKEDEEEELKDVGGEGGSKSGGDAKERGDKRKSRSKRKGIVEGKTEMDYLHPKNRNKKKNNNKNNNNKNGGRKKPLISKPGGVSLANLVRDIKNRVKVGRGFWSHFPYALCNDEILSAPSDIGDNCWNGKGRGRYERGGGEASGGSSPKTKAFYRILSEAASEKRSSRRRGGRNDVEAQQRSRDANDDIVAQQLVALRDISAKLNQAYEGFEVDWLADAVADEPHSEARRGGPWGSGDGNPSGDGNYDDDDDDDDDDEDYDKGSGSGEWEVVQTSGNGDISFDPENPLKPDISPLPGKDKTERADLGLSTGGVVGGISDWQPWMTMAMSLIVSALLV